MIQRSSAHAKTAPLFSSESAFLVILFIRRPTPLRERIAGRIPRWHPQMIALAKPGVNRRQRSANMFNQHPDRVLVPPTHRSSREDLPEILF
jgi:hypothetical protein